MKKQGSIVVNPANNENEVKSSCIAEEFYTQEAKGCPALYL